MSLREWFPFHASAWANDEYVIGLSLAERGAYIELLGYQWRKGSIPDDHDRLRRICRCSADEFAQVWPEVSRFFQKQEDGSMANPRLLKEWLKALSRSEKGREAANRGWEERREPSGNPKGTHREPNGSLSDPNGSHVVLSSVSVVSSVGGVGELALQHPPSPPMPPSRPTPADIEAAYKFYPRKDGKGDGVRLLRSEIKTHDDLAKLKTAIGNYARVKSGTEKQYIKKFDSFAAEWRDWLDPDVVADAEAASRPRAPPSIGIAPTTQTVDEVLRRREERRKRDGE